MHADGKLTELEMKEINIFMVNRLAYIFNILIDDEKIEKIFIRCKGDVVENLCKVIVFISFLEGFEKGIIDRGKLTSEDIN